MPNCPGCEGSVALEENPRVNEIVECGECAAELEILSVDPLELAIAPEVEEDWGE
ncbi:MULTISPECIES: lysine biosynthesis protein LysW [unclassified Streptomyces]|uniref:lysine biosynthesis protein LysW n=1 Tax=unclassified Streptomyces TaxID=2593676 RepID=UPI00136FEE2F|nr:MULTISPECIES: lysine biosynthesis protein LysW [unclassified Streptomyces]MCW5249860.1 lysine biosynthesis protein LysW [Streptomyces sp. SHP 1-2]MYU20502.1 lysine biosynthesis protein LysW [Streptomyces sp. SID8352]